MIKKADIILSAAFIAVAVLMLLGAVFFKTDGKTVEITVDGENFGVYQLDKDQTIEVKSDFGVNIVEIKDGRVRVTEADCPDKYCVSHVPVENHGETVVCLPHKMIVEVKE